MATLFPTNRTTDDSSGMCYFTFEDNTGEDNKYTRRGYRRVPQTERER